MGHRIHTIIGKVNAVEGISSFRNPFLSNFSREVQCVESHPKRQYMDPDILRSRIRKSSLGPHMISELFTIDKKR